MARTVLSQILILTLAVAPAVRVGAAVGAPSGVRRNAADLARGAERAVAYTVKVARDSKDAKLDPKSESAKPFWKALQKLNLSVDKVERGLFLKDETFFIALADSTSAIEEAKISLRMSGARDLAVSECLARAERAISILRERYGIDARRRDSNAELTEEEIAKLNELKLKQAELSGKLAELEGKVKGNRAVSEGIRKAQEHNRRISSAGYTAGDFFAAMFAVSVIDGILWGWSPWWGPWWGGWWGGWYDSWMDVYYVSVDIVDIEYDWAWVEEEIDVGGLDLDVKLSAEDMDASETFVEEGDFRYDDAALSEPYVDADFGSVGAGEPDFDHEPMDLEPDLPMDDHGDVEFDDLGGGTDLDL